MSDETSAPSPSPSPPTPGPPADLQVVPPRGARDRVSVLLRLLLAIPHLLLVGGLPFGLGFVSAEHGRGWSGHLTIVPFSIEREDRSEHVESETRESKQGSGEHSESTRHSFSNSNSWSWRTNAGDTSKIGALGYLASTIALLDWFAILFLGHAIAPLVGLKLLYLRWRARFLCYFALLRDEYPPFGDGPFPASFEVTPTAGSRNRLTVALRPILVLPHVFILGLLTIPFVFFLVVSWLVTLTTAEMPPGLWRFQHDYIQWLLRVEAYLLLVVDDYPPFSLG